MATRSMRNGYVRIVRPIETEWEVVDTPETDSGPLGSGEFEKPQPTPGGFCLRAAARALKQHGADACTLECLPRGDRACPYLTHDALELFVEGALEEFAGLACQEALLRALRRARQKLRDSRLSGEYPARFDKDETRPLLAAAHAVVQRRDV